MTFVKITEQPSLYNNLEQKSVSELLHEINAEDQKVALAVQKALPQIERFVLELVPRMKQGTAQKMTLNMISPAAMIYLRRVKGNRMVNMQLSNAKLIDRGTHMIMDELGASYEDARRQLLQYGLVREAIEREMVS